MAVVIRPPGVACVSEWEDPDRFLDGLDLYRAGKAPRLLFTGGASPFRLRQLLPGRARILLVTSAFHMRRAQRLFERQGMQVLPFPVDFQERGRWAGPLWRDPTQWLPSARALDDSSRALRELIGRLVYRSW